MGAALSGRRTFYFQGFWVYWVFLESIMYVLDVVDCSGFKEKGGFTIYFTRMFLERYHKGHGHSERVFVTFTTFTLFLPFSRPISGRGSISGSLLTHRICFFW